MVTGRAEAAPKSLQATAERPPLTTRAGTPATTQCGGTSFVTTAPAPMVAPSPIVIPHKMVAFDPIDARRQTRVRSTVQSPAP